MQKSYLIRDSFFVYYCTYRPKDMKQTLLAICLLCCLPFYAVADPPMGPSLSDLGLLACMAIGIMSAAYTIVLAKRKKQTTRFLISLGISLLFSSIIWPGLYHIYQNNALYSIYAPKSFLAYLFNLMHPKKSMMLFAYALYCIWAIVQGFRAIYRAMQSTS